MPLPPYIKEQGGRCGRPGGSAPGGVLLPPGVGLLPFRCWIRRRGGKRWRRRRKGGRRLPLLVLFGLGGRGARPLPWPPLLISTKAHYGPFTPGGVPVTPGSPVKSRFHPENFRYPNIGFQYINLHVSTISRLLVMSVITSGTPNNLRYIKTHKLII